jgi:UDP-glucose 4-epimerase
LFGWLNIKLLVIGGAGYIGSHFVYLASQAGFEVTVFDDLSTGHDWAVGECSLIRGNTLLDAAKLSKACEGVDVVIHFAAKSVVAESVNKPLEYLTNNVLGVENVLWAMEQAGVRNLVFSSTAAVYGVPPNGVSILSEDHLPSPINPYGESKLKAEKAIEQWAHKSGGKAVAFRYFNAGGAMPEAGLGEAHDLETHLIPNVLKALLIDSGQTFELYGADYPTQDGSCIRDYIHVKDIAFAHLAGLEFVSKTKAGLTVCNLGSSKGHSNFQVIRMCERVSGRQLRFDIKDRRVGDPPILVASNSRAKELLEWYPRHSSLEEIVESAYRWHEQYG